MNAIAQPSLARWLAAAALCGATLGAAAEPGGNATREISPRRARTLYTLHCSGCHLPDGSGSPAHGVPSMRGALGHFPATLAGRAFLVQAPGARNSSISDAELAALTNWQLREFAPGTLPADFKPYTAEEVARFRAAPPLDVAAARAAIVAGFPAPGDTR
ncbi:hypothetical protein [Pseudoduganella namucuonensis]|uniref:Cytochrome c n=1 Tax=Pseudoduganella namucuonensis TaxID=1035707 RepID=A0A1I7LZ36_9BURK|nr:hypothetical protein [Pseudoduganella namucuonensis]SFV14971.1 hypothetical protein SAMN05216552_104417 [Pseudoduganella namucuonensis]